MQNSDAGDCASQLLSDSFDNAAVGLHWLAPDGTVLRVNRAGLDMLGREEGECVGHLISEFHVDPSAGAELLQRLAAGEALHNFETAMRRKDGSVRHVAISCDICREDGRFAHARCFMRDITSLKSAQQALAEAERRKGAILDASLDAILTMDHQGRLLDFNRAAEQIFGYPRDEALGRPLADLIVPPRLREQHWQGLRRYLATGEGPVLGRRIEIDALHARGHEFPVELSISVVEGVDPPLFTATVRDISERRAAEEERRALLDSERAARSEAERLSEMKDDFLATLSHELRTPLSAILGWAHMLRTAASRPGDLAKGLDIIERNARIQTQLIDELLDTSRIASGKVRLELQHIEPAGFVEAALETVKPAADAKGIRLVQKLDAGVGRLSGDPGRLQQVVWNLLTNAIKFTPEGGEVVVELERSGNAIVICVTDTGSGIAADFLPHVFERFRQADASTTRRHGGLGLGLAIVRNLVELHGGTVSAASAGEGRGSTFAVRLPVAPHAPVHAGAGPQASVEPVDGSAMPAPQRFAGADLSGVAILAVDDEPDARELLVRVLQECNATVFAARGAEDALRYLEGDNPADVLVSDIGMPEIDGYELLRRVRARGVAHGGGIPAIALTAFARPEDRARAMAAGFQAYLAKPLEPSELVACVAALARRGAPQP